MSSKCILLLTAILVASEVILASKRPQTASEVGYDLKIELSDLDFIYYYVNLASKSLIATISRIFPGEKPARDQRRGARTLVKIMFSCFVL